MKQHYWIWSKDYFQRSTVSFQKMCFIRKHLCQSLRNNYMYFSFGRLKIYWLVTVVDFALLLLAAQNDEIGKQLKFGLLKWRNMGDCKKEICNPHIKWKYSMSITNKNLSQSALNSKSSLHWAEFNHSKGKGQVDSDSQINKMCVEWKKY